MPSVFRRGSSSPTMASGSKFLPNAAAPPRPVPCGSTAMTCGSAMASICWPMRSRSTFAHLVSERVDVAGRGRRLRLPPTPPLRGWWRRRCRGLDRSLVRRLRLVGLRIVAGLPPARERIDTPRRQAVQVDDDLDGVLGREVWVHPHDGRPPASSSVFAMLGDAAWLPWASPLSGTRTTCAPRRWSAWPCSSPSRPASRWPAGVRCRR